MRQKEGTRSRFVKACFGSWSCVGADKVQEEFQLHPCPVACAPFHRARRRFGMFKFDENEVSLQLFSKWTLAAYCGFFREENIVVLEARSILYVVQHAESHHPP